MSRSAWRRICPWASSESAAQSRSIGQRHVQGIGGRAHARRALGHLQGLGERQSFMVEQHELEQDLQRMSAVATRVGAQRGQSVMRGAQGRVEVMKDRAMAWHDRGRCESGNEFEHRRLLRKARGTQQFRKDHPEA